MQEALKLFAADSITAALHRRRSNLVVSPDTRARRSSSSSAGRKAVGIYDVKVQDPAMVKLLNQRRPAAWKCA